MDLNGTENLSRIAAVALGKNTAATVDAFPNPFTGKIKLRISSPAEQVLQFKVLDMRGITLFAEKIKVLGGTNMLDFDFRNLPSGVYMFTFTGPDSLVVKRLMKE